MSPIPTSCDQKQDRNQDFALHTNGTILALRQRLKVEAETNFTRDHSLTNLLVDYPL